MSYVSRVLSALLILSVAVWSFPASAIVVRDDVNSQAYLDLGAAPQYASVGQVISDGWLGSGTLIAPNWVLTAAHVVEGAANLRFNLNGTVFTAARGIAYPKWNGNLSLGYDIGLIQLTQDASTATGIAPAQRYSGGSELGTTGTFVGYGMTGTGLTGATVYDGVKRAATNMIDVWYFSPGGKRIFGADFDNPHNPADSSWGSNTPLALEGLIAPGDSGGGVFVNVNGTDFLAGVHSFGQAIDGAINSDYGDRSGDTRVSAYVAWIDSYLSGGSGGGGKGGGRGGGNGGLHGYALDSVPEPSTLVLLVIGLVGLAWYARRRRA